MASTIIALCGLRRCGKDTVARYLQDKYNYEHIKISCKLKQMMKLLFDFSDEQLESNQKEEMDPRWGTSPRKLMQYFGTEVMQYHLQNVVPGIGRNYFVNAIASDLNQRPRHVVVSDLRFMHEYDVLRNHGRLIVVEVVRDSCCKDDHASENEFQNIPRNIVLTNNASLQELYDQVDRFMSNQTESHDAH